MPKGAVDDVMRSTAPSTVEPAQGPGRWERVAEITLIVVLFFVLAGTPPPDVNEAHYLAKAKHYWNPTWCVGDPFLESADAHLIFYWTFGWLTQFFSLTAVAWIGRFLTWGLLAWGWQRLSSAVAPGRLNSVLSAALFTTLVEWGHMAGEWIIGGVEAKGFAYIGLLFALESLVHERWRRACVYCGAAAAFHVLVGGWGLVVLGLAWLLSPKMERPPLAALIPAWVIAGSLALPGLLPGLALTWGVDSATVREANRIYVFERLSHHLVFHEISPVFIVRHALLMVTFLAAWRWLRPTSPVGSVWAGPLPRFVCGAMLIAVVGAILDQSLLYFRPLAATLLRYYWFRMSDVATPLGVALASLAIQQHIARRNPSRGAWILIGMVMFVTVSVCHAAVEHWRDPRPGAVIQAFRAADLPTEERMRRWREWQQVCGWIDQHTSPTDLFLTPRFQQTFKWDANRAEVVSGKDIPQDAAGLVAWRKRMDDVFPYTIRFADLVAHGEPRLRELSKKYGFRYIVIDRSISAGALSFRRVYPERTHAAGIYEVYDVGHDALTLVRGGTLP